MSKDLITSLRKAAPKSKWVSWLVNDDGDAACSTQEFLNTCLANIPETKHQRIFKKLASDQSQIEATLHELVAHELLRRLGLAPEFEPSLLELTPDLSFEVTGKKFVADVYLTHSPTKTLQDFGDGTGEARDTSKPDESRAHKIANELAKKANKYRALNLPLVIFVFLGDHRILSTRDVQRSLFGMTVYECSLEERFPESVSRELIPVGGLLLPDEEGNYSYRHLSAVICCDWFDTLNRHDRGKRLHCVVFHNWLGEALPRETFKYFSQILWERTDAGGWKPKQINSGNIVAKFTRNGGIEYHRYTPNTAW